MNSLILTLLIGLNFITSFDNTIKEKYYSSEIIYLDGSSKNGFSEYLNTSKKNLKFKSTEEGEVQEISFEKLKTIKYFFVEDTVEFDRLSVYGWKNKISDPGWLKVIERGVATLYVHSQSVSHTSNSNNSATFINYYCIRDGEPAATTVSIEASMNSNAAFKKGASKYFEDYEELSNKIRTKVYKYPDLLKAVKEYNAWAENQ